MNMHKAPSLPFLGLGTYSWQLQLCAPEHKSDQCPLSGTYQPPIQMSPLCPRTAPQGPSRSRLEGDIFQGGFIFVWLNFENHSLGLVSHLWEALH